MADKLIERLKSLKAFLNGEAPLFGVWWNEISGKAPYSWRKELPVIDEAAQAIAALTADLEIEKQRVEYNGEVAQGWFDKYTAVTAERDALREAFFKTLPGETDTDAQSGPCCYELMDERWIGTGCECGNYGDCEQARSWADDANRRIDMLAILEKHGIDLATLKGGPANG